MLKVGLIGAGHLGKIHLKLLKSIDEIDLVGFYDSDCDSAKQISEKFEVPFFKKADELIEAAQALDIVTPTPFHYQYAMNCIAKGKHFFIEKPIAQNSSEATEICELAKKKNLIGQIGHVERFNPAFLSVKDKITQPLFIETHRLAQFNPRGTDVSVVLDLMIHDLDLILKAVNDEIVDIQASGVALISQEADIVNARLSFKKGCVANITASRLSVKNMRKMRIFQPSAYLSLDFLGRKSEIVRLTDEPIGETPSFEIKNKQEETIKYISFDIPTPPEVNAIEMELKAFKNSILHNAPVQVSLEDGKDALDLALKINKVLSNSHAQAIV